MAQNHSYDSSMSYFKNSAWGKVKDTSLTAYPHVEALDPFPTTTPLTALQQVSMLSGSQHSGDSQSSAKAAGHVAFPHEGDQGLKERALYHKKVCLMWILNAM